MSYQVLARKWRPQRFEDVTGQEHVTTALRNAIATKRVPHAVLLCGPRGVGKTTIARILARCLNCEKGPTSTPCGSCTACHEIIAGSSTDVQEIDAASRTSVDNVRELIESIRYAAAPGKYRIYVVDEVHMLSNAAFNALLKTLEEPPPRSLFVFATTEPDKIPFTVTSRCQRYDLRRLPTAEVATRLADVAREEGVAISAKSLLAIAREGEGSLRDSLTLLDQVIAVGGQQVEDDRVSAVLDLIDRRILFAIVTACVDREPAVALGACARAGEMGIEAARLGKELVGVLRDLVVLRVAADATGLVEGSDTEIEELRAIAARSDPGRLRRMFRALVQEQEDLAWAPQPFAVLEMAVVRLATLSSGEDVAGLLQRLDALERRMGGTPPEGAGPDAAPRQRRPTPVPPRSAGAEAPREPAPKPTRANSPDPAPDLAAPEEGRRPDPPRDPSAGEPNGALMDRLRALALERDRALGAALDGARIVEQGPDSLRISVPQAFAAHRLLRRSADLEAVCARLLGRRVRVDITGPEGGSTQVTRGDGDDEDLRRRRRDALAHPAVNAALEILGGEVVEIRTLGEGRR